MSTSAATVRGQHARSHTTLAGGGGPLAGFSSPFVARQPHSLCARDSNALTAQGDSGMLADAIKKAAGSGHHRGASEGTAGGGLTAGLSATKATGVRGPRVLGGGGALFFANSANVLPLPPVAALPPCEELLAKIPDFPLTTGAAAEGATPSSLFESEAGSIHNEVNEENDDPNASLNDIGAASGAQFSRSATTTQECGSAMKAAMAQVNNENAGQAVTATPLRARARSMHPQATPASAARPRHTPSVSNLFSPRAQDTPLSTRITAHTVVSAMKVNSKYVKRAFVEFQSPMPLSAAGAPSLITPSRRRSQRPSLLDAEFAAAAAERTKRSEEVAAQVAQTLALANESIDAAQANLAKLLDGEQALQDILASKSDSARRFSLTLRKVADVNAKATGADACAISAEDHQQLLSEIRALEEAQVEHAREKQKLQMQIGNLSTARVVLEQELADSKDRTTRLQEQMEVMSMEQWIAEADGARAEEQQAAQITEAQQAAAAMESKFTEQISALQTKLDQLQSEQDGSATDHAVQIHALSKQIAMLEAQKLDLESKAQAKERDQAEWIEQLETQLATQRDRVNKADHRRSTQQLTHQHQFEEASAEIARINAQIAAMQANHEVALKRQLGRTQRAEERLNEQSDRHEAEHAALVAEHAAEKARMAAEIAAANESIAALQAQITSAESNVARSQALIKDLEENVSECETAKELADSARAELIAKHEQEIQQQQAIIAQMQAVIVAAHAQAQLEGDNLSSLLAEHSAAMHLSQVRIAGLQQKLDEAVAQKAEQAEQHAASIAIHQAQTTEAVERSVALQAQHASAEADLVAAHATQLAELEAKLSAVIASKDETIAAEAQSRVDLVAAHAATVTADAQSRAELIAALAADAQFRSEMLAAHKAEINERNSAISAAQQRVAELEQKLADAAAQQGLDATERETMVAAYKTEIAASQQQIAELQQQIAQASAQKAADDESHAALTASHISQLAALHSRLSEAESHRAAIVASAESEQLRALNELAQAKAALRAAEEAYEQAQADSKLSCEVYDARIVAAIAQKDAVESERATLATRLAQMESAATEAESAAAQKYASLQSQIDEVTATCAMLQSEKADLASELAASIAAAAALEQSKLSFEKQSQSLQALNKTLLATLSSFKTETASLNATVATLQAQREALEANTAALVAKIEVLEGSMAAMAAEYSSKVASLQSEVQSNATLYAQAQRALEQQKTQIELLELQLSEREAEAAAQQAAAAENAQAASRAVSTASTQLLAASKEVDSLKAALDVSSREVAATSDKLAITSEESVRLREQSESSQVQLTSAAAATEALRAALASAHADFAALQSSKDQLESKLYEAQESLAGMLESNAQLLATKAQLSTDNKALRQENAQYKEQAAVAAAAVPTSLSHAAAARHNPFTVSSGAAALANEATARNFIELLLQSSARDQVQAMLFEAAHSSVSAQALRVASGVDLASTTAGPKSLSNPAVPTFATKRKTVGFVSPNRRVHNTRSPPKASAAHARSPPRHASSLQDDAVYPLSDFGTQLGGVVLKFSSAVSCSVSLPALVQQEMEAQISEAVRPVLKEALTFMDGEKKAAAANKA